MVEARGEIEPGVDNTSLLQHIGNRAYMLLASQSSLSRSADTKVLIASQHVFNGVGDSRIGVDINVIFQPSKGKLAVGYLVTEESRGYALPLIKDNEGHFAVDEKFIPDWYKVAELDTYMTEAMRSLVVQKSPVPTR